jgi:hypothetical protein
MKTLVIALCLMATSAFAQMGSDSEFGKRITLSSRLNEAKGVNIAVTSSGLVDLNSVAGNLVHVSAGGSTIISSFGTASQAGIQRLVFFDGVQTLAYSASVLVVPGNTTFNTAAGDSALIVADSASKWIVRSYTRQATTP